MDKRLVLVFAVLLLVPMALAAEQCVWYKGKIAATTYDMFIYAGLGDVVGKDNVPHSIDAYADSPGWALFFAGDTVYGYNKNNVEKVNPWEVAKIAKYYPVSKVDAIMYHGKDVTTVISGRNYWYRTGPAWEGKGVEKITHEWKGPFELKRVAMNFWKPKPLRQEYVLTYPIAPAAITTFNDGHAEQLYIAENATIGGKAGIKQWFTAGSNANYWYYSFRPFSDKVGELKGMTRLDAAGQMNKFWLIFGQGDCVPLVQDNKTIEDVLTHVIEVPYENIPPVVKDTKYCNEDKDCKSMGGCFAGCWNVDYNPIPKLGSTCPTMAGPASCVCVDKKCTAYEPGDITPDPGVPIPDAELQDCKVTFVDNGFDAATLKKKVSVKVNGRAADVMSAAPGYWGVITSDNRCSVSGNNISCPCFHETHIEGDNKDIRVISAYIKYTPKGGINYYMNGTTKVCKLRGHTTYGSAVYHFFDGDGLKACNPERVMADSVTVNTVNARFHKVASDPTVLLGIDLTNIGTDPAVLTGMEVLHPEVLVAADEARLKPEELPTETTVFDEATVVLPEEYARDEGYAKETDITFGGTYAIPGGKLRHLEVAWDPRAQVVPGLSISLAIAFEDGSSLAVPIENVPFEED